MKRIRKFFWKMHWNFQAVHTRCGHVLMAGSVEDYLCTRVGFMDSLGCHSYVCNTISLMHRVHVCVCVCV